MNSAGAELVRHLRTLAAGQANYARTDQQSILKCERNPKRMGVFTS